MKIVKVRVSGNSLCVTIPPLLGLRAGLVIGDDVLVRYSKKLRALVIEPVGTHDGEPIRDLEMSAAYRKVAKGTAKPP